MNETSIRRSAARWLGAAAIAVGLGLGTAIPDAAAQERFRFSADTAPGVAGTEMLRVMRDELEAELGDAIEIEYFDNAQLGDEFVHLEQIRAGAIDVTPIGSDAVQLDSKWAVFDIPFLFSSLEQVHALVDGPIGDEMKASMRENAGIEVLGLGELGFRHITNNVRPIVVPADLQGLKMRVPGSESRLLAFEMLGASPITMSTSELYLAFQQGVVDGHENALSSVKAWSYFEVQDYLSLSGHVYTAITLAMNGDRWDGLSDEMKDAFQRAADKAVAWSREASVANDAALREELQQSMTFNDIDRAAFQEAAVPIWDEVAKIAGEDFAKRAIAEVTGN
jgi:tripartite ATP-independent transporter DctP family solute receptor